MSGTASTSTTTTTTATSTTTTTTNVLPALHQLYATSPHIKYGYIGAHARLLFASRVPHIVVQMRHTKRTDALGAAHL